MSLKSERVVVDQIYGELLMKNNFPIVSAVTSTVSKIKDNFYILEGLAILSALLYSGQNTVSSAFIRNIQSDFPAVHRGKLATIPFMPVSNPAEPTLKDEFFMNKRLENCKINTPYQIRVGTKQSHRIPHFCRIRHDVKNRQTNLVHNVRPERVFKAQPVRIASIDRNARRVKMMG